LYRQSRFEWSLTVIWARNGGQDMSAGWQVTIIGSTFTKVRYVGAVDRQGEVKVGAKIRTSLDDPATSKQALARLRM